MMHDPDEARNQRSGSDQGGSQQNPENPQEIAEDIARTRAEMGETVDAIEERLSPQRLKEEAKHTMREQTVGRAEQAIHSGEQTVKQTGQTATETIKQHPIPAAMVGIGLGWLVMEARRSSSSQQQGQPTMSQAQAKAGQFASQVEHGAQHMGQQATQQAQHMGQQVTQQAQQMSQQAKGRVQGMLQQNPLGLGALAFGAGAAVGAVLPGTHQEDLRMGQAQEKVVHKAEQKAQDTLHKVEHVAKESAHQAQQTAKQDAKKQGLTG
jgi:hypothetical protein